MLSYGSVNAEGEILKDGAEFHTVSDGLDKEKCEYLVIMDLFLFVLFQPGPDYDLLRALG